MTATDDGRDAVTRVLMALHPEVEIEAVGARGGPAVTLGGEGATTVARAWFYPQPEHRGNHGWLHGGFAATILDHVCARAAAGSLGERVVTGRLELKYRRPVALTAGPYLVTATAWAPRRRTVKVVAALADGDGAPLVEATALFVARPVSLDP